MKFEVQKGPFYDLLQIASNAIPNKTTLQILNNFLFKLEGKNLNITATDLDLTVNLSLEVQGSQNGGVVVNAKKFLEVVREMPDLPIYCSVDDYVVTLKSKTGFHCNIAGFDASEYPSLPSSKGGSSFKFKLQDFKFLFEKTGFAVSTDMSSRAGLSGVYFVSNNKELTAVATDGHRLGKAVAPINGASSDALKAGIIIPPRAISQVIRIAEEEDEEIQIEAGDASVKFQIKTAAVYSKLIEGPYPDYEKVIPTELTKEILSGREELMSVLRRVATMANSKTRQVKFSFSKDEAQLSAKNQDIGGDTEEKMPIQYKGKDFVVGYNANYLLEVLRLIHTDEVKMRQNSNLGATIVEPAEENPNYFFIVMPLRLFEED